MVKMKTFGNIIWFILFGFISAVIYCLYGIVLCITIIGIPVAKQCFKLAKLSIAPFGKEIVFGGKAPSLICNIIWIFLAGLELAMSNLIFGLVCCSTIILIPLGLQFFKFAKLSFMPFGATIVNTNDLCANTLPTGYRLTY